MTALFAHALVVVAGLAAYVVLTVTGHDGNIALETLAAYAGGSVVQAKAGGGTA